MNPAYDKLLELLKYVIDKVFSARFLMVIFCGTTLCIVVLLIMTKCFLKPEAYAQLKDPIMLLLGAFVTNVATIVANYFNRTDREKGEVKQ